MSSSIHLRVVSCFIVFASVLTPALAQNAASDVQSTPVQSSPDSSTPAQSPAPDPAANIDEPPGGKRILGVLPNYRTADASQQGTVLTAKQKLTIASKDSFDYPLVLFAGVLAGIGQLANSDPSFGQGAKGYFHRLGTNYADQATGNMMTEGFFPVMLHEDPRYFRRGTGSIMHRAAYAATRVFVAYKDSGGMRFNYSEWLGNATAVAISNAYYPDSRTARDGAEKLLQQVGADATSQVLKEFWPDIKRKFFHRGQ